MYESDKENATERIAVTEEIMINFKENAINEMLCT